MKRSIWLVAIFIIALSLTAGRKVSSAPTSPLPTPLATPWLNEPPLPPVALTARSSASSNDCLHHYYFPLLRMDNMIISRFGTNWVTAYQLGQLKGADEYQTQRPASVAQVGGMGGAFDFWGAQKNPIAAQTVVKKFNLVDGAYTYVAGTGTIYTRVYVPFYGAGIYGIGTHFLTDFEPGCKIRFTTGGDIYVFTITAVLDDTLMHIADAEDAPIVTADAPISYEIGTLGGILNATYGGIEVSLDALKLATLNRDESKLWALRRDTTRLWAWAKCNRGHWPEDYNTKLSIPVELEFYLREGVWYGETEQGTSITQASATYTLTNHGTSPANVKVQVTSSTGTLTSLQVTNSANGDTFTWTGSATVGQLLKVDTGAWQVRKAGGGAYSGLTYGSGQANWLRLEPGANTVTVTIAGSTAWGGSISWWDTYL